jgi:hypothetical protein
MIATAFGRQNIPVVARQKSIAQDFEKPEGLLF